ncbi:SRPBCC family protein [Peribacillus huizhouensis]|uniref:Uncharacterized protein YndB with AHSA1/START domain n=1 Tax=Peribacillus huizhouensis TaxID=1501239 RepID=A0ABR6CM51_9BACI|nr:SRPBCC family protein [Peribacillus huizhouensis]MBA9026006.1 uncharacterized protein YndB with AHSA1/START domain [Peribacillus huizhouensis]
MLAKLKKGEHGYIARFERHVKHSVEKVWAMLTENDKLAAWFSELRIDELRKGGIIKFDMQDGTFEKFTITDFKLNSVLEFTWDKDLVRFELYPEQDGCLLVLIEKIDTITDHTPRDLAGWHVCLDVIQALLDGRKIEREVEWKQWYEKYTVAVKEVSENQE